MTNFVQDGETIEYSNTGTAITAGSVVVIGKLLGIAATDIAATTGVGTVCLEGVFKLAKNTSTAITQGDQLFWDNTAKEITKVGTDLPIGTAHESALAADTTVNVNLYEGGDSVPQAATVAAVATANATDLATAQALANQLKTTVNAILTNLKAASLMA